MNTHRRLALVTLTALLAAASLPGCGYSLAGRGSFLPTYIQTIGVPPFLNLTTVIDAERILTERVQREFIGRGKFKVVPNRTGVDALVTGSITSISFTPAGLTTQQQASRYALTVTANIEFKDLKTNKVLWANPSMQFRDEFEVSTASSAQDANAFFGQNADALDRVATEFARAIVSAIVEAF
jgi:outer membrane lipopolysaccharide assembly protein LptE/RlpB